MTPRSRQARTGWSVLGAHLPRGGTLRADQWRARHRGLIAVLLVQLPILGVLGLRGGLAPAHVVAEVGIVAVLAGLGAAVRTRRAASVAVTLGLMGAASVLVHLTGGITEAHFAFFVLLGLVALYQDWVPFLVAAGYVLVSHGVLGVTVPQAVYSHDAAIARPWLWALVHTAALLASATAGVLFWTLAERSQRAAERHYRDLYDGQRAVERELRETERIKGQLLAVVSHEFRTPLAGIIGLADTLGRRGAQLDPATLNQITDHISANARRLARLIDNVVAAADPVDPDPAAATPLAPLLEQVVGELAAEGDELVDVHAEIDEAAAVAVDPRHLHLVLRNLVDNAVKFADPGSRVVVTATAAAGQVQVGITNVGAAIPPEAQERIFQAFAQVDSSDTRAHDGLGLGLHVVRRVVEAYGGEVALRHDVGRTRVDVAMPAVSVDLTLLPQTVRS